MWVEATIEWSRLVKLDDIPLSSTLTTPCYASILTGKQNGYERLILYTLDVDERERLEDGAIINRFLDNTLKQDVIREFGCLC